VGCATAVVISAGYMGMPDKTDETIDSRWLHSGDIVKIDDDHDPKVPKPSGFISITGVSGADHHCRW
jgi:acyl-CoA synthetase (AMP-forming)/AMP-acid ligase II